MDTPTIPPSLFSRSSQPPPHRDLRRCWPRSRVGILAGSLLTRSVSGKEQTVDSSDARPLVIPQPKDLSNGFAKIAKEVGPAVVNINTESLPKQSANRAHPAPRRRSAARCPTPDSGDNQGDMQDFFNRFFGGQGAMATTPTRAAAASARRWAPASSSTPRGYIITNNHVVDKADKIYVKLSTDPDNPATRAVPRRSWAWTRTPTSPSSRSTRPSPCPPSSWATPTARRSATGCSPSAARSPSRRPSPPASSRPRTARSMSPARNGIASRSSRSSSRPTPPSIRATRAARWSIWPARSSA